MKLDKKTRLELAVTVGFGLAFLFIVFGRHSGGTGKTTAPSSAAPMTAPQAEMAAVSAKRREAMEKLKTLGWGRDPFVFGTAKIYPDEENALSLNGIAWDENTPSAIINNRVVKVGDQIAGNKIADIKKDKVIVMRDGNLYELNLRQKAGQ